MSCDAFNLRPSDFTEVRHDVVLRGIFIHPDHLSAGFCADETSYSSSSETASTISYDDDGSSVSELSAAALEGLALECHAIGSTAQDENQDYFAPRSTRPTAQASSDAYPMDSSSTMSSTFCPSPSSTAATTPTCSSPALYKSTPLVRRSSHVANLDLTSAALPATFPFAAFGAPASHLPTARAPLPRAPSPSRSHPYTRFSTSGAAMHRSVSSPVETQRQVDERQQRLNAAEDVMDTRACKMARSKSGVSTPAEPAFLTTASAPMTRRSSGMLVSPLSEVFGPEWGKALPPAPLDASKPLAFPYNVARPPLSPLRNARSRSFAGLDHAYEPMSLDAMPELASANSARTLRPRSRLSISLGPLTPILPDSDVAAQVAADATSEPARNRLYRGMSF
ncbi:hypothetical protein JCM3774_004307 [Rhodotorula dairenensis]